MASKQLAALALLVAPIAGAQVADFITDCGLEPPGAAPVFPVPPRPGELPWLRGEPPRVRRERARGTLALPTSRLRQGVLYGKTVYVSGGHGFTSMPGAGWRTQRGNSHQIVEDLVSIETVNQLLVPLLLNAGAVVVPLREPDLNTALQVVDDQDSGYSESGPAASFHDSTLKGYGHPPLPMSNGVNPFELGKSRLMDAASVVSANATFAPNLPADGYYQVAVAYPASSARVSDAHFVVKHAGGEAHFRVNQRRHGGTWLLLGRFYFRQGLHPDTGSVVALNDSQQAGNLSLDAVRFGGGMGLSDTGLGPSGRPRFEECARYHAQYAGAPTSVYAYRATDRDSDVVARSRFVAWDHETGEDAVYVSWHTNAFNGSALGTDLYVYGPNPPDGTYQFTGVPGSDRLAQLIRGELVNDIRNGWGQTSWKDRGIHSAYFGELNPDHNPETPAVLMEVAFHDNLSDATQLKEPGFRYVAARAIAQGIIRYFADKDQLAVKLPPEPPLAPAALNLGGGQVEVRWRPPATDSLGVGGDPPQGYRLYMSLDGLAWDEGVEVSGTRYALSLPLDTTRYFRLTSVNEAGESFPSEVVGARASSLAVSLLVVNAYDRLEAALGQVEDLSAYALGSPLRIFIDRMNDGSYLRRHGDAVALSSLGFDGASAAAVSSGELALSGYSIIDWFAGRGHSQGDPPAASEQQLLRAHVEAGKGLLFSGAQAASRLAVGNAQDQAFLAQVLHASGGLAGGSRRVDGRGDQFLAGLTGLTLDDGKDSYDTGSSDVLTLGDGAPIAQYAGEGGHAAVAYSGTGKVVFLSFPFETVVSPGQRAQLMARSLQFLGAEAVIPDGGFEEDAGRDPDGGTEPDAGRPEPVFLSPQPESYPAPQGCGCGSGLGGPAGLGLALLALIVDSLRGRRIASPAFFRGPHSSNYFGGSPWPSRSPSTASVESDAASFAPPSRGRRTSRSSPSTTWTSRPPWLTCSSTTRFTATGRARCRPARRGS